MNFKENVINTNDNFDYLDKYNLTKSQKSAFIHIAEWIKDPTSMQYVLSGSAGTGKSYLINVIIRELLKNQRLVVSAPTHKAVRVIERFTGKSGKTIQSLNGLRPNFNIDNFKLDDLKFEQLADPKIRNYNFLIIDEASMIPAEIVKLNSIQSMRYNVKIMYVGDELQLTPVKEHKISSVFNIPAKSNLTDIVRQTKTNPLLDILIMLRDDISNDTSNFLNYVKVNTVKFNDDLGYVIMNRIDYSKYIKSAFNSNYYKHTDKYRLSAYTKNRVQIWNKYIRKLVTSETEIIAKNDVLMGYKTIVDEMNNPIIINSNDYKVEDVIIKQSNEGFKVFITTLLDLENNKLKKVFIVDHTDKSFKIYYKELYRKHFAARYSDDPTKRAKLWIDFYKYKEQYLSMIDFNLIDTDTHRVVAYITKELDYAYAVTVHKLQGSTIENTLVDLMDIVYYNTQTKQLRTNFKNNRHIIDLRNRLLYTAISRASKKAIMLYY